MMFLDTKRPISKDTLKIITGQFKKPSKKCQHLSIREQLEREGCEEGDGNDGQQVEGSAAFPSVTKLGQELCIP